MPKLSPSPRALKALVQACRGVLEAAEKLDRTRNDRGRSDRTKGDFALKKRCRRLNDSVRAVHRRNRLIVDGWRNAIEVADAITDIVELNEWILKAWSMAELLSGKPYVFADLKKQTPPKWMTEGRICIHRPPDWPPGLPTDRAAAAREAVNLLRRELKRVAPKPASPDQSTPKNEQGKHRGTSGQPALKPSHQKAALLYEWAIENIPGADAMTYFEIFERLRNHPHCHGEGLPDNAEAFARYCRGAGIRRNQPIKARRPTRSVRQSTQL